MRCLGKVLEGPAWFQPLNLEMWKILMIFNRDADAADITGGHA